MLPGQTASTPVLRGQERPRVSRLSCWLGGCTTLLRTRHMALCVSATLVAFLSGCSILQTALIVIKGTDVPAEFKELTGKRVAVVCRSNDTFQFDSMAAAKELSLGVGQLLRRNVKKIDIVDSRKIGDWTDRNDWEDYPEIGEAVDADYVVGIDLDQFSLQNGQTLLQGRASVRMAVYDMAEEGKVAFEKNWPDVSFPTNGLPVQGISEKVFRQRFVEVLALKIATLFYKHDGYYDFANDATAVN